MFELWGFCTHPLCQSTPNPLWQDSIKFFQNMPNLFFLQKNANLTNYPLTNQGQIKQAKVDLWYTLPYQNSPVWQKKPLRYHGVWPNIQIWELLHAPHSLIRTKFDMIEWNHDILYHTTSYLIGFDFTMSHLCRKKIQYTCDIRFHAKFHQDRFFLLNILLLLHPFNSFFPGQPG